MNQRIRWSAEPWVHSRGLTRPVVMSWIRSSPTDLAAALAARVVGAGRVGRPHPGVAVGLELEPYGVALRALLGPDPAHRAEHVLDVVAVLVREHVGLDEVAGRPAELLLEDVAEEAGVEV